MADNTHMADDSVRLAFVATCPKCNGVRYQAAYAFRALIQLLDDNSPIEANCKVCGQTWAINEQDRAAVAKAFAIFR